jgi:hypothetical protein
MKERLDVSLGDLTVLLGQALLAENDEALLVRREQYQLLVLNAPNVLGASGREETVVRDLAWDLEFYDPFETDPTFFGLEKAKDKIRETLHALGVVEA